MSFTIGRMRELLPTLYEARGEVAPCLLGLPGIGKTQVIEEFARERGVKVVHLILSQVLPTEVSGITMPDKETGEMEVFDSASLRSLEDGDVLFLDELLKAQQPVLAATLTLVQERRLMSGRALPDVFVVAAANPVPPSSLPVEIKERFMFFEVGYSAEQWAEHMASRHGGRWDDVAEAVGRCLNGPLARWNSFTPRTAEKAYLLAGRLGRDERTAVLAKLVGEEPAQAICDVVDGEGADSASPYDAVVDSLRDVLGTDEVASLGLAVACADDDAGREKAIGQFMAGLAKRPDYQQIREALEGVTI